MRPFSLARKTAAPTEATPQHRSCRGFLNTGQFSEAMDQVEMGAFTFTIQDEVAYLACAALSTYERIVHAFSTRLGGVSTPPYASLNLGFGSGDERERVHENRTRYGLAVGFDAGAIVALRQVHGNRVAALSAGKASQALRGSPGDALITDRPQLPLAVITADCYPVVLVAPKRPAVGVAHAGRQGTASRIVPVTIELMCRNYRLTPQDILAAIGPGIGGCCYEVDEASAEPFLSQFSASEGVYRSSRPGHLYLDLQQAILRQLAAVGVPVAQIWSANLCTACHPQWFYSYRRDGKRSGRMLNMVMIH